MLQRRTVLGMLASSAACLRARGVVAEYANPYEAKFVGEMCSMVRLAPGERIGPVILEGLDASASAGQAWGRHADPSFMLNGLADCLDEKCIRAELQRPQEDLAAFGVYDWNDFCHAVVPVRVIRTETDIDEIQMLLRSGSPVPGYSTSPTMALQGAQLILKHFPVAIDLARSKIDLIAGGPENYTGYRDPATNALDRLYFARQVRASLMGAGATIGAIAIPNADHFFPGVAHEYVTQIASDDMFAFEVPTGTSVRSYVVDVMVEKLCRMLVADRGCTIA
jgi:hypothetical protein